MPTTRSGVPDQRFRSGESPGMNVQITVKLKHLAGMYRYLAENGERLHAANAAPIRWAFNQTYNALIRKGLKEFNSADEAYHYLQSCGFRLEQLKGYRGRTIQQEISEDDYHLEHDSNYTCTQEDERPTISTLVKRDGPGVVSELREVTDSPEFKTLTRSEQDEAIQNWLQQRWEEQDDLPNPNAAT